MLKSLNKGCLCYCKFKHVRCWCIIYQYATDKTHGLEVHKESLLKTNPTIGNILGFVPLQYVGGLKYNIGYALIN